MNMTEKQAQEIWCPKVQVAPDGAGNGYVVSNRGEHSMMAEINTGCIGARCAWWEWEGDDPEFLPAMLRKAMTAEAAGPQPERAAGWKFVPDEDGLGAGWLEPQEAFEARRMGYCSACARP